MSTSTTPTILQSTFLGGAAAVFAVNFTHPIELVKSRVQENNMGVVQTISDTMKNEGIAAFWKVRWLSFQWYSSGGFFSRKECGHCCLHPISRRDATTERLAEISDKWHFVGFNIEATVAIDLRIYTVKNDVTMSTVSVEDDITRVFLASKHERWLSRTVLKL